MNVETAVLGTANQRVDPLGSVTSVTGARASIALHRISGPAGAAVLNCPSVGELVKIVAENVTVVGLVSEVATSAEGPQATDAGGIAKIEFLGELAKDPDNGELRFLRGVSIYPRIADLAWKLTPEETVAAHVNDLAKSVNIGTLVPQCDAQARINIDNIYGRHFAVLGSTGTGKTCAVSLFLNRIIERVEGARIFVIDPHDEYRLCFGDIAEIVNPNNISLPFWLFNFEEIIDVFFKARPGVESEVEILRDLIPAAKRLYARNARANGQETVAASRLEAAYTVDTPVPYRLSDLTKMIENRMGSLEERDNIASYKRLKARIETVSYDPRYAFMFSQRTIDDNMSAVIGHLFRVPANGKPVTILEIAGFPTEVVDALVSVVCRLAFDFNVWSSGALPLLVVCEEAHRYIPASRSVGFGPTRRAISRLAKEGRKYRLSLALVSQRPAEIDPTILSQCNSIFALRMTNEADQAIIRAAVIESAAGMLNCLPSIGEREAIAFGDAVSLPMRLRFASVPQNALPQRMAVDRADDPRDHSQDQDMVERVVATWRAASTRYTGTTVTGMGAGRNEEAKSPAGDFADGYDDPAEADAAAAIVAEPEPDRVSKAVQPPGRDPIDWHQIRARARGGPAAAPAGQRG